MKRKAFTIIFAMVLVCAVMAFMESVVRPGYGVKSCVKVLLFSAAVLGCGVRGVFRREGLGLGIVLGGAIFAVILGAFFLCRPFIDLGAIAGGWGELFGFYDPVTHTGSRLLIHYTFPFH